MTILQKLFAHPVAVLRLSLGLCYTALGIFLLLNQEHLEFVESKYRLLIAAIFIAYGLFRLYRAMAIFNDEEQA
jgi:hypothetical protein